MTVLLIQWFNAFKRMQNAVLSNSLNDMREANAQLRDIYQQMVDSAVYCPESRQLMRQIETLAQGPNALQRLEAFFARYQGEFPPTA